MDIINYHVFSHHWIHRRMVAKGYLKFLAGQFTCGGGCGGGGLPARFIASTYQYKKVVRNSTLRNFY